MVLLGCMLVMVLLRVLILLLCLVGVFRLLRSLSGSSPSSGFDSRFSVLGLPRVDPLPDVNHVPVFSGSANFR